MKRRFLAVVLAGTLAFSNIGMVYAAENPGAGADSEAVAAQEASAAQAADEDREADTSEAAVESSTGEISEAADSASAGETSSAGETASVGRDEADKDDAASTDAEADPERDQDSEDGSSDPVNVTTDSEEDADAEDFGAGSDEQAAGTSDADAEAAVSGSGDVDSAVTDKSKDGAGTDSADSGDSAETSDTGDELISEEAESEEGVEAAKDLEGDQSESYVEDQWRFGDRDMLPGWDQWIDRWQDVYVLNSQYPSGQDLQREVTNVQVKDVDGENVVIIEHIDEDGWSLSARNKGTAKVTVTYTDWDGTQGCTTDFTLHVGEDVYGVELWTESGSDRVLPGRTVKMTAQAWHEQHNSDGDADLSGIRYEWEFGGFDGNEDYKDLIKLSPTDGQTTTVSFEDVPADAEDLSINVVVTIYEDGDWKAENNYWLHMMGQYLELWPSENEFNIDLDVGQSTTIRPELRAYTVASADYSVLHGDQVRFEVEQYDDEAYTIKESEQEPGTYVVTRRREYDTSFRIRAFLKNESGEYDEVDSREYWFHRKEYHFCYDIPNNDTIFTDGDREFRFDLHELDGLDYELVPEVGTGEWNEGSGFDNPIPMDDGWNYNSEDHTMWFNGEALGQKGIDRIETRISLRIGGNEVADEWRGFDVREPEMDYWGSLEDEVLFVDDERWIDMTFDGFFRGTNNPDGGNVNYIIKRLSYEAQEDPFDTRDPISLTKDDNGWRVRAVRGGEVVMHAQIVVQGSYDTDGNTTNFTFETERDFRIIVGGFRVGMSLTTQTGSDRLQSGSTMLLTPQIHAEEYDWQTGERREVDTSGYEVRYEVYCHRVADEIVQERYNGDYDAAMARGELWDYETIDADRTILLKAIDENAYDMELEVAAFLIDPESGDEYARTSRNIMVDRVIFELELHGKDGNAVQWDEMLPPGAEMTLTPVLMRVLQEGGVSVRRPMQEFTPVTYRFEYYSGAGDDDPAHLLIRDRRDNPDNPVGSGQEVTSDDGPFTIRRNVERDFDFAIVSQWTDDEGNDQKLWTSFSCSGIDLSGGFNCNNDRGDPHYTWYYLNEPIEVEPDRSRLDELGALTTVEAGYLEGDEIKPIIKYEIDKDGKRGGQIGEYDISGIFNEQSGLNASGKEVKDLYDVLRYQADEYGSDYGRIALRIHSELGGVELVDYLMQITITKPYLEIEGLREEMGVHQVQTLKDGETSLYLEDKDHDTGDYYNGGTCFDIVITDIALGDPQDAQYLSIEKEGDSWKLTALKECERKIPLIFRFSGGPDGYDRYETGIAVNRGTFAYELRNAGGETIRDLDLIIGHSQKLVPYVTYTEEGNVTLIPAREGTEYYFEADEVHYDDRVISFDPATWEVTAAGQGNETLEIPITVYDSSGQAVYRAYAHAAIHASVTRTELTVPENAVFYAVPGGTYTADQIIQKIKPVLTVYSMKNPDGVAYPVAESWFDAMSRSDIISLSDGTDPRFGKMTVAGSAAEGVIKLLVGASESSGNMAGAEVKIAIHKHVTKSRMAARATLAADGTITNTCTVCGEMVSTSSISHPATFKLAQTAYTYTGAAFKPAVTVTDAAGRAVPASAYDVAYADNIGAGTGKATVTFKGNYSGTKVLNFTIRPAAAGTFAISKKTVVYNGKAQKPAVTVKDAAGRLIPAANYTVTYSNNKNPGTAVAKITMKGNYTGAKSLNFTINPKPTKLSKLKAEKKAVTVKWKKQAAQTSGYQIQYSLKRNFKSAKTKKITGNKTVSVKIMKLNSGKKYYFRIRTYKKIGSKYYYSAWSAKKSVKVK